MFKKLIFVVLSYIFIQPVVFAESNNSSITIDYGKDEQANSSSTISVDLALKDSKRLFFGVGKSKIPAGNQTIDSNLAFLGLSKKYSKQWKISGSLDYSGQKNAFTTISLSTPVRYSQDNYYLELVPAVRRINLSTLSKKDIVVSSTALGLKAGLYLGEHFRLSGNYYSYTYSEDVSKLASFVITRYLSKTTLLLSSGLLTKSYNAETGLDFKSYSVSLGQNRSVSAIDNSNSDFVYSVLDYYLSDTWSLSFLYGAYLNTPEDQNNYSSVTVGYSF